MPGSWRCMPASLASPITISGAIHVAASYLASPGLVAATLLLSRRFDDAWRRDAAQFLLALASWVSLVVLVIVNYLNLQVGGIGQRIFLAVTWWWLMRMALRVRQSRSGKIEVFDNQWG